MTFTPEMTQRLEAIDAMPPEMEPWFDREQRRVDREWSQWDGTLEQGRTIARAQTARIWAEISKRRAPQ